MKQPRIPPCLRGDTLLQTCALAWSILGCVGAQKFAVSGPVYSREGCHPRGVGREIL
jgi:hypothetical protein